LEAATSTGIEALDIFLKGGLPRGYTTLMLAPAGSGSEIFAKQFAAGGPNDKVVYVTTDESTNEVHSTARSSGWNFANVTVVDLQTEFAEAMMDAQQKARDRPKDAPVRRTFDPRELVEGTSSLDLMRGRSKPAAEGRLPDTDYLGRLLDPFSRLRSPDRMVVHSLDFFLNLYPLENVVSALTALKAANAKSGGLLLLVLSKGAHGGNAERRLELLADCLIELEVTRKGTSFERFFMVKKVKNRSYGIGVSTYEITPQGFHLETLERIV
jgi:KaiC/GvpD/RAD55 family RecA-like ATPase